jgi:hypothetical protein
MQSFMPSGPAFNRSFMFLTYEPDRAQAHTLRYITLKTISANGVRKLLNLGRRCLILATTLELMQMAENPHKLLRFESRASFSN